MSKIRLINELTIQHVRGISSKTFQLQIFPNKPNLLVAPNGFGKSSIAAAFSALKPSKMDVPENNSHGLVSAPSPRLSIRYLDPTGSTGSVTADQTSNGIKDQFDVAVINSRLTPKSRTFPVGGGKTASASSIEVDDIVLIDKVLPKERLAYSCLAARKAFGNNGKVLPNIGQHVEDMQLMARMPSVDFSKENGVTHTLKISGFKYYVNSLAGTSEDILDAIDPAELAKLASVPHIENLKTLLNESRFEFTCEAQVYCAALQLADLHKADKETFKKVSKHAVYAVEKDTCVSALKPFKSTWKGIAPQESKGRLVLKFPSANQISNGERDTLCLVGALITAERKLKGECAILIIDEVFDYLDDANLIACQYYLTQMIERWKRQGRQLIPVILTHLDPSYFRNFTFKDQKVSYLARTSQTPSDKVHNLIKKRSSTAIDEDVSRYFLHFHPANDCDLTVQFAALGLSEEIATATSFREFVDAQLLRYLADKSYDPVSVCCAVRNLVEKKAFESLSEADRDGFLAVHKTAAKLDYASSKGSDLPHEFYLLSIIYNEAAHIKAHSEFLTPLFSKLDNLTIKHMIREIANAA
ncbi:ATP-binding cassette domain-containing protein [Endobacterium cereale]|uniref:ATP-binding cassette domain-containing protein n=1 Tax=Endobacterium cereale TaxID=2663029 RepID=UPI002B4846D0|nr:ABC transporter ATP-binding protein [Endobacterium cereale]MEB2846807.1 ABC transporter ATP-binding protein [Endobacterium cereale]